MSTEDNKALIQRVNEEGLNQHNPALVDETCAPNFVFHNGSRTIQGLPVYKRYIAQFFRAFPDIQFTTEDLIAEGDIVAVRRTFRGTHKGSLMGIPPTGKQVTITGTSIMRIANGKILEEWINSDLMQQLGVTPTPEQAS